MNLGVWEGKYVGNKKEDGTTETVGFFKKMNLC